MDHTIKLIDQNSEGTFTIPSSHYIDSIFQRLKSGTWMERGVKYGFSHGSNDLIGQNNVERLRVDFPVFSYETDTVIYYDATDNWGDAIIDIFVVVKSLEV